MEINNNRVNNPTNAGPHSLSDPFNDATKFRATAVDTRRTVRAWFLNDLLAREKEDYRLGSGDLRSSVEAFEMLDDLLEQKRIDAKKE